LELFNVPIHRAYQLSVSFDIVEDFQELNINLGHPRRLSCQVTGYNGFDIALSKSHMASSGVLPNPHTPS
jgi:hypothetical protein